jgi:hypothetical protein
LCVATATYQHILVSFFIAPTCTCAHTHIYTCTHARSHTYTAQLSSTRRSLLARNVGGKGGVTPTVGGTDIVRVQYEANPTKRQGPSRRHICVMAVVTAASLLSHTHTYTQKRTLLSSLLSSLLSYMHVTHTHTHTHTQMHTAVTNSFSSSSSSSSRQRRRKKRRRRLWVQIGARPSRPGPASVHVLHRPYRPVPRAVGPGAGGAGRGCEGCKESGRFSSIILPDWIHHGLSSLYTLGVQGKQKFLSSYQTGLSSLYTRVKQGLVWIW